MKSEQGLLSTTKEIEIHCHHKVTEGDSCSVKAVRFDVMSVDEPTDIQSSCDDDSKKTSVCFALIFGQMNH